MSLLHTWRRWFETDYRWETAADQAILDSQDDLLLELQEIKHLLSASVRPTSDIYGFEPLRNLGMSDEDIRRVKRMIESVENP